MLWSPLFYTQAQYARHFSDIESRKEAFLAAKARVDQHNAEADQGLHLYHREVTKFSIMASISYYISVIDWLILITWCRAQTPEESKMYMGLIPASKEMFEGAQEDVMNGVEAPASVRNNRNNRHTIELVIHKKNYYSIRLIWGPRNACRLSRTRVAADPAGLSQPFTTSITVTASRISWQRPSPSGTIHGVY